MSEATLSVKTGAGTTASSAGEVVREVPVAARATGDPQVLGWLVFVVGSTCLGLQLVGYVPAAVVGGPLPIILGATALGLLISSVWAAYLGQTYVAGAFGLFAGFWVSYTTLVLGLQHNWFLIPPNAATKVIVAFLIAWTIAVFFLLVSSVRLPLAYTIELAIVVGALAVLAMANNNGSAGLTKLGGVMVLAFAALGAYIWLSTADQSLGGPGYPLGKPMRK